MNQTQVVKSKDQTGYLRISLASPSVWLFMALFLFSIMVQGLIEETMDEQIITHAAWSIVTVGSPIVDGRYDANFISRGIDNRIYPKFPPGQSYLISPFIMVAKFADQFLSNSQNTSTWKHIMTSLFSAIIFSGIGCIAYIIWKSFGYSRNIALISSALLMLTTQLLPFSRSVYPNITCTLLALIAFACIRNISASGLMIPAITGLALGCSVWIRPITILFCPLFLLYAILLCRARSHDIRRIIQSLVTGLIAFSFFCLLLAIYNNSVFGSPFNTGYENEAYLFSSSIKEGLHFLLLNLDKGLFISSPLILISIFGFKSFSKDRRLEMGFILIYSILYLTVYSGWYGSRPGIDPGYGQRYLLPLVPFLCFPVAEIVRRAAQHMPKLLWCSAVVLTIYQLAAAAHFSFTYTNWVRQFPANHLPRIFMHFRWIIEEPESTEFWWVLFGIQGTILAVAILNMAYLCASRANLLCKSLK